MFTEFCRELGVELAEIREDSRARYIWREGRLRRFPLRAGEAVSAFRHAALTRAENHLDTLDLETWGRRHLGEAALDYLLTPFVGGIYGARPGELGVEAAFPELALAPGQTLLGAMLRKATQRSTAAARVGHHPLAAGDPAILCRVAETLAARSRELVRETGAGSFRELHRAGQLAAVPMSSRGPISPRSRAPRR